MACLSPICYIWQTRKVRVRVNNIRPPAGAVAPAAVAFQNAIAATYAGGTADCSVGCTCHYPPAQLAPWFKCVKAEQNVRWTLAGVVYTIDYAVSWEVRLFFGICAPAGASVTFPPPDLDLDFGGKSDGQKGGGKSPKPPKKKAKKRR